MWEIPSSYTEDRASEERLKEKRKIEAQKEQSKPLESDADKQMKVVISERLPAMKEEIQRQMKEWQERVKAMREKEFSLSNFITPENYWGFSTLVRWDGNTNSWAKVDLADAYKELIWMRSIALPRLEYALKEWKRWEEIQKDPLMKSFLDSPEWKLILSISQWGNEADILALYYLNKARELKQKIPKWELLAQPLYEKLKWTKYEAVAKQEQMNIAEEVWKKYVTEIGNELLWADSLLIMAASWPIWGLISKWVKSERVIQVSTATMEAVNTSKIGKVLVPWVKVVPASAVDGKLAKVWKWAANILVDAWKIWGYYETVKYFWWDEAAKIASYVLLFIPWAKAGFETDMKAKFGTLAPNSATISAWALEKFWEDKLKKMLYDTSLEQMRKSGKTSNPERLKNGVDLDLTWEVEKMVAKMKEIAATASKNTPITEVWAQGVRGAAEKVQSTIPKLQEWVKTKVAETLWKWEQIKELIKLGIPEKYLKAIEWLWIDEAKIATKYKNWKTDPDYKVLVETGAAKYGLSAEEAHAVYGYTIWIFDIPLNNLLRSWWWRDTEMYKLLLSGLEKMPKVSNTVQLRWDSRNFKNMKVWDQKVLDWFVSTSSEPTPWFWDKAVFKVTINDAVSARDISELSFYKNFAKKIWKEPTNQE